MTRRIHPLAAAAAAAGMALAVCAEGGRMPETSGTSADRALSLLGQVARETAAPDVVVSPEGVSAVLAVIGEGARGETADALARYLGGLAGRPPASPEETPALRRANSVWVREGFALRPAFIESAAKRHGALVRALDFASPAAPAAVNGWVRDATGGRIPSVIDQISSQTRLLVVNAMHFKAAWLSPFDSTLTEEGDFAPAAGGARRVPLMTQRGRFAYYESPELQAVELPYEGGRYAMVLLLPASPRGLDAWLADPGAVRWNDWSDSLRMRSGTVTLPRFEIEFGGSLAPALRRMGLAVAFDPDRADLGGIAEGPARLFIEDVIQKVVLEVHERGTEAASATVGVVGVTSADPLPPFVFRADRPFLCAVRDRGSGEILFLAAVRAAGTV